MVEIKKHIPVSKKFYDKIVKIKYKNNLKTLEESIKFLIDNYK